MGDNTPSDTTTARHERDLLGVILLLAEAGALSVERLGALSAGDFVSPHAAATFQQLRELLRRDGQVDRRTLVSELVTRHDARRAEALEYVDALIADAPIQHHVHERIRRVRDAAARRRAAAPG